MSKQAEENIVVVDDDDDEVQITSSSQLDSATLQSPSIVVDLTKGNLTTDARAGAGAGFARRVGRDEVEFVSVSASPTNAVTSDRSIFINRVTPACSYVQFVGTKRPKSQDLQNHVNVQKNFNRFNSYHRNNQRDPRPYSFSSSSLTAASYSTSSMNSQSKKNSPPKKRPALKSNPAEDCSTAMTKGKTMQTPTGFDAIDMYYPRLKAADRTKILYNLLFPYATSYNKKSVHEWRVNFEKSHPKAALWSLARGLSDDFTSREWNPSKIMGDKENIDPVNSLGEAKTKQNNNADVKNGVSVPPTLPIGTLSADVLDTLATYFRAHIRHAYHKARLAAIKPTINQPDQLNCCICCDDFDPSDTIACTGEGTIHFFCKTCLASYCTVTVQSGPIQTMTCPMPDCNSLFAIPDIKSTLSEWDMLMIEHRESSRDRRVAMASKAMLHCECGVVAVITEEDMGDGRIACPGEGCGRRFCAKCGNDDHGKDPCPPPTETVQWLDKNSKECPNCRNRIEKNGGCDHMTCQPPGGCGHEFWWTCGCPYRGEHKPGCQRLGERSLHGLPF